MIDELEEGDRVLFEGRKKPLEVTKKTDGGVEVEGPNGGEYEIYEDDGTVLYCRKGNRKYSSYCENLRKVGEWKREKDRWKHSDTGTEVWIEENRIGYWVINSEGIEIDLNVPKYGFTSREKAENEVEKFLRQNPEG